MDEGLKFPREERIRLSQSGWNKIRKLVYERDGYRCIICGSHSALHVHHVRFRSAYGSDTLDNLVCVCAKCHDIYCHGVKSKRWRNSFIDYLAGKREWNEAHKEQALNIYTKHERRKSERK